MKNKELLDNMFGEHSHYYYINKFRGIGCANCLLKKFCDSYYKNRAFTSCGVCGRMFLEQEVKTSEK